MLHQVGSDAPREDRELASYALLKPVWSESWHSAASSVASRSSGLKTTAAAKERAMARKATCMTDTPCR